MLPDESSSGDDGPPLDLGVEGGCGNAVVEDGEFCDDGNLVGGDGCEFDCTSSDDVEPEFFLTMGGPNGIPDCGSGVVFDSQGNVIFGGYVLDDIWIRKYDTDYQELWTVTYPGEPGALCSDTVLAVDSEDNIAFAGSTGLKLNVDWIFGKLDPDGVEVWSETLDGPVGRNDRPHGVAVDGDDAFVFVGNRENPIGFIEAGVLKYDNDGTSLWSEFVNGNGFGEDNNAVAIDPCDEIVVSGVQYTPGTSQDIVIRKYASDGGLRWEAFESTDLSDYALGVGVGAYGDITAVGAELDPATHYFDFWSRRYSADGRELWTVLEDGGAGMSDAFSDVAVIGNGESWAGGITTVAQDDTMAVVRHAAASGAVVYTRTLDLEGGADGWAAIARASDGRVAVAGSSQLPGPYDLEAHFAVYPP